MLAVFGSVGQVAVLHPQSGSGRCPFPGELRFIENKDVPGSLSPGVIQLAGEGLETEAPEVPKVLYPGVCQESRGLFGGRLVIPLKDGGPEDKDFELRVRVPLQDF